MREHGLQISGLTEAERHSIKVNALHITDVQRFVKEPPIDIAFICVKSYDTEWATHLVKPYLAPDGELAVGRARSGRDQTQFGRGGAMSEGGVPQLLQNEGRWDRTVRVVIGIAAVIVSLTGLIAQRWGRGPLEAVLRRITYGSKHA